MKHDHYDPHQDDDFSDFTVAPSQMIGLLISFTIGCGIVYLMFMGIVAAFRL